MPQSPLELKIESWAEVEPELRRIADSQYEETGIDGGADTMDWDEMRRRNEAGQIILVAARDAGRFAGYFWASIGKNPINRFRQAAILTIYLVPAYRHFANVRRLVSFSETMLGAMGIEFVYIGSRQKKDICPLLDRLGYVHAETIMEKRL